MVNLKKLNFQKNQQEFFSKISIIIAFILFLIKNIEFSLTRLPNLDEGAYLYQGLSFARGDYQFLQPYGFFTGKIYLSYFIWGWIQLFFGAGLTAPRIFTIFLNLLSLLGIYLTIRKKSPLWAQAIVLWSIAINFSFLKILSIANSQVIVFFLMVWVIYFFISFEKETIGVVSGSILLGIMILTRENMLFFVFPSLVYIFWDKGRKNGVISLIIFSSIFIVGNALFYPQILKLWMVFVPRLFQSINNLGSIGVSEGISKVTLSTKIQSVANTVRLYSIEFYGILAAFIFIICNFSFKFISTQKKFVYLLCSFIILLIPHFFASVELDYCPYCFSPYTAFFIPLAFIIIVFLFNSINNFNKPNNSIIFIYSFFLFIILICISFSENFGARLLTIPFPNFHGFEFQYNFIPVGKFLIKKFHFGDQISRQIISFILGFIIIFVLFLFTLFSDKYKKNILGNRSALLLIIFFILISFRIITNMKQNVSCQENTLRAYEKIGIQLNQFVPPNSSVYIEGSRTAIPLLYLKKIFIYPPQINGNYSYSAKNVSNDTTLKNGKWNSYFKNKWLHEANVLIFDQAAKESNEDIKNMKGYELSILNLFTEDCHSNFTYYVYVKK